MDIEPMPLLPSNLSSSISLISSLFAKEVGKEILQGMIVDTMSMLEYRLWNVRFERDNKSN